MDNHLKRLALGTLIAFLLWTSVFVFLKKNELAITAFCAGIVAIIALSGTLLLLANGQKKNYPQNAAFILVSWRYLLWNIALSAVVVLLDVLNTWTMPYVWFIVLHVILFSLFAWRLLAMSSGKEMIEATDQKVKEQTLSWKMLKLDAEDVLKRTPASLQKEVAAVVDAIRYADPMSHSALQAHDEAIAALLRELDAAAAANESEKVSSITVQMTQKIADRNQRAKLLK